MNCTLFQIKRTKCHPQKQLYLHVHTKILIQYKDKTIQRQTPPDSDDLYTIPNKQDHLFSAFGDLNVIQQNNLLRVNFILYLINKRCHHHLWKTLPVRNFWWPFYDASEEHCILEHNQGFVLQWLTVLTFCAGNRLIKTI